MDETQILLIDVACRRLFMRYSTFVDGKDYDQIPNVFAPDAVWERVDQPPIVGAGPIREMYEAMTRARTTPESPNAHLQRHCFTTVDIDVIDADHARAVAYALVYREERPLPGVVPTMRHPELMAEYRDDLVRTDKGWRIAVHRASHVFREPGYAHNLKPEDLAKV